MNEKSPPTTTPAPPPLPHRESTWEVWRIYLRAAAFLTPSMLFWVFSATFALPKVRQLWQDAGLESSPTQWLMDVAQLLSTPNIVSFAVGVVVIVLLLVEFRWGAWPRYRRAILGGLMLCAHLFVLAALTAMTLAATIAAPLLPTPFGTTSAVRLKPTVHTALARLANEMALVQEEHRKTIIRERMFDVILHGFIHRTPGYEAPKYYGTEGREGNAAVRRVLTDFLERANAAADANGLDTPQKRLDAFNAKTDLYLDEYFGHLDQLTPPDAPITDQPGDFAIYGEEEPPK